MTESTSGVPPTDHVARALLRAGAKVDALVLLRAAIERDPGERACAALLRAIEARPDASVSGPEIVLDLSLVDGFMGRGMLVEALAVLRGTGLARGEGRLRAGWLEELLRPPAATTSATERDAYLRILAGAAALALAMLDEAAKVSPLSDEFERRRELLRRVMLDSGVTEETTTVGARPSHSPIVLARALSARINAKDLAGALELVRSHCAASTDDAEARRVFTALGRIVETLDRRPQDGHELDAGSTTSMSPEAVADLHVRMGNLVEAERLYRKLSAERGQDTVSRRMADDVQCVRVFVDHAAANDPNEETTRVDRQRKVWGARARAATEAMPSMSSLPPPASPSAAKAAPSAAEAPTEVAPKRPSLPPSPAKTSVAAVRKSHPRVDPTGYAAQAAADLDDGKEEPTDVVRPEMTAELYVKQGKPELAIEVYESLVKRAPSNAAFAARLSELRAMLDEGDAPLPGEMTVRADMESLREKSKPTATRLGAAAERAIATARASAPPAAPIARAAQPAAPVDIGSVSVRPIFVLR